MLQTNESRADPAIKGPDRRYTVTRINHASHRALSSTQLFHSLSSSSSLTSKCRRKTTQALTSPRRILLGRCERDSTLVDRNSSTESSKKNKGFNCLFVFGLLPLLLPLQALHGSYGSTVEVSQTSLPNSPFTSWCTTQLPSHPLALYRD